MDYSFDCSDGSAFCHAIPCEDPQQLIHMDAIFMQPVSHHPFDISVWTKLRHKETGPSVYQYT